MRRSSRRAHSRIDDPRLRPIKQFGGSLLKNSNAKSARPLSTQRGMHIVLHSEVARGSWALEQPKNRKLIDDVVRNQAKKYGISLREVVSRGECLHLVVKLKDRRSFAPFIRAVSGMIALMITGSGKTRSLKKKFWSYRPWSRIIELVGSYSPLKDMAVLKHLVLLKMYSFEEIRPPLRL